MNLSKSLYTIAIQCPKALWLKKYKPEVLTPTDEFSQAKFNIGHAVGELACNLLPNGIKVDFNELERIISINNNITTVIPCYKRPQIFLKENYLVNINSLNLALPEKELISFIFLLYLNI